MSKLKLEDVNWKEFSVQDKFDVKNSKPYHKENLVISEKGTSYITRTSLNNGLDSIVDIDDTFIINSKNTITLGAENADFFYQENDFITGNKMYIIRHEEMNKYNGLFLVQVFRQSIKNCGFGYGKGLTGTRFLKRKILLPIDSQDEINWQFMEDYIKQEQKRQAQKIIDYYEHRLIQSGAELLGLEKIEWKEFEFNKIFKKIQRGKRLTKGNQIEGDTPYVSSTAMNNGVDNFISNKENVRIFNNCLTVANSGSVGSCFFHHYEFVASDHVTSLNLEEGDKYTYLFMASIIKRLEEKYSFNREINDKRIRKEKIILPADEKGNPNYEYMRIFMQQLEKENLSKVLEYIYI